MLAHLAEPAAQRRDLESRRHAAAVVRRFVASDDRRWREMGWRVPALIDRDAGKGDRR